MKSLIMLLGLLLAVHVKATPYSLEGYIVDAYMERTIFNNFPIGRINGFGLDSAFEVADDNSDLKRYDNLFTLDVNKDNFTIDFTSNSRWLTGIIFNLVQPDYATTTTAGFWSNVVTDTNLEGLVFHVEPGWLKIDFSDVRFTTDSYITAYFKHLDVPEPSMLILSILGLSGLFAKSVYRRKRTEKI